MTEPASERDPRTATPGSLIEQAVAAYAGITLRGLRLVTRASVALLRTVTDDPRTDAIRAEIAATLRRLLELPESIGLTVGATRTGGAMTDVIEVRRRFQDLLARSSDVRTVQGEAALLDTVQQLTPDEARMLLHLAATGPAPAGDLVRLSITGTAQEVVVSRVTLLAERAGAAEVDRSAVYVRNLLRLDLIEWQGLPVPDTADYQLIEGRPEVAGAVRAIRAERGGRSKLRRGRLALTPLGERLLALGAAADG